MPGARTMSAMSQNKCTALFATPGTLSSTESYLNSLSQLIATTDLDVTSATETAREVGAEEYLTNLSSQITEAAIFVATTEETSDLSSQLSGLSYKSLATTTESSTKSFFDSQLSGLSYETFGNDEVKKAATSTTKQFFRQTQGDASTISNIASSAKSSLGSVASGISDSFSKAESAGSAPLGKLFAKASTQGAPNVSGSESAPLQAINGALEAEKNTILKAANEVIETEKSTISKVTNAVGEKSLSDIGDSVVGGIKTVGNVSGKVLNVVVEDTGIGTKVAKLVAAAQTSINTMIDNAVHSVQVTMNDIGNITITQAIKMFIKLIVAIVNILFMVINAVLKVVSGKPAQEWALVATGAVKDETGKLLTKTAETANNLSHKSLGELSSMVGKFSHDVSDHVVSSLSVLGYSSQSIAAEQISSTIF